MPYLLVCKCHSTKKYTTHAAVNGESMNNNIFGELTDRHVIKIVLIFIVLTLQW